MSFTAIVITSVLTSVAYRIVADLVVRPWFRRHRGLSPDAPPKH